MTTMRPFEASPESYAQVLDLRNRFLPIWARTLSTLQYMDAHPRPGLVSGRAVMVEGGAIVGCVDYFEPPWSATPDKFILDCFIDPDREGSPTDAALIEGAVAFVRERFGARAVAVGFMEDRPRRGALLESLGFAPEIELKRCAIDLCAFDPAPFAPWTRKALSRGIRVETERALKAADPDYITRMWELELAISHDIPSPDPVRQLPLESFARDLVAPWNLDEGTFVALDGDAYVGLSTLKRAWADPERLTVGLTGVRREYRRLGIATLLKLHAIEGARRLGALTAETMNEASNPMLQLNLALGFEPLPAWIGTCKQLPGEGRASGGDR